MVLDDITIVTIVISAIAIIISIYAALSKRNGSKESRISDSILDVPAIVKEFSQRIGRLEGHLVDQNVRLEIFGLRLSRLIGNHEPKSTRIDSIIRLRGADDLVSHRALQEENIPLSGQRTQRSLVSKERGIAEFSGGSMNIDKEILKLVMDGKGYVSDIQVKISRSREHTARKMNSLFMKGLVERNASSKPFFYTITNDGRKFVNS